MSFDRELPLDDEPKRGCTMFVWVAVAFAVGAFVGVLLGMSLNSGSIKWLKDSLESAQYRLHAAEEEAERLRNENAELEGPAKKGSDMWRGR